MFDTMRHKDHSECCARKIFGMDWDWIVDMLPGKIQPTDIDAVLERNGHFLYMEQKGLNATISKGKEILFKALLKNKSKSVCILVSWCGKNDSGYVDPRLTARYQYHTPAGWGKIVEAGNGLHNLQIIMREWLDMAQLWSMLPGDIKPSGQRPRLPKTIDRPS